MREKKKRFTLVCYAQQEVAKDKECKRNYAYKSEADKQNEKKNVKGNSFGKWFAHES